MQTTTTKYPSFLEALNQQILVLDGAMGTTLFSYNLTEEDYGGKEYDGCPEHLNITQPNIIKEIHTRFLEAGADIIETNTFGGSELVLSEYNLNHQAYEINSIATKIARQVCDEFTQKTRRPTYVAGSIGPGTKLVTLGNISFDTLKNSYKTQIRAMIDAQADLILIETCQDTLQIKSCLLAAFEVFKEIENEYINKYQTNYESKLQTDYPRFIINDTPQTGLAGKYRLPIQVQVTIETTGTLLVGAEINAALVSCAAFPIDVFGMNCATGPKEMQEHIQFLSEYSPYKLSCVPNAGIPENICGHAHFPLQAPDFSNSMENYVNKYHLNIVGGCCGTTYEHIRLLSQKVKSINKHSKKIITARAQQREIITSVSSLYSAVSMETDSRPIIVGERTNANGSKLFKDLLAENNYEAITELAKEQISEGAQILDLCAAYVGRNEIDDMRELIFRINTSANIPIMIDSTEADVIEESLKLISGKAIVNSVNLEDGEDRVAHIAGLCNKYGAALVVLTIDEDGMAKTAKKKFQIAQRLHNLLVNKHGMKASDLIFDTLTFTLGAGDEEFRNAGIETNEAIKLIKKHLPDCKTILGVSNISFGLDKNLRPALNSVFLHHAVQAGLDMAIVNNKKILPLHKIDQNLKQLCQDLIFDKRQFTNSNEITYDPLTEMLALTKDIKLDFTNNIDPYENLSIEETLAKRIIDGNKINIENDLDNAMASGNKPLDIINKFLMSGMKVVGERFASGEMQLPFVLQSATTMKKAVAHLENFMDKLDGVHKGTIVIATVKGDVHDIGKNLVDIILSNNGYKVHNLGIKQTVEQIISAIEEFKPDLVAMSGLLVKSTLIMKQNLEVFNDRNIDLPIILGGAALTRKFVEQDCASIYNGYLYYGYDAFTDLDIMDMISSGKSFEEVKTTFYKTKTSETNNSVYDTVQEQADKDTKILNALQYTDKLSNVRHLKKFQIPQPPFIGFKHVHPEEIAIDHVWKYLNLDALFIGQWRMNKGKRIPEEYAVYKQNTIMPILKALKQEAFEKQWLKPRIAYGYFYSKIDSKNPNKLNLYLEDKSMPIANFIFPRQSEGEYLCLTDYARLADDEGYFISPLQLVTMGVEAADYVQALYQKAEYDTYLYNYGFAVEMTEALAEYAHKKIREELSLSHYDDENPLKVIKSNYYGMRYSFGYPACPRLEDQEILFDLLDAGKIGMELSEEWQIHPEHSTSAIVVLHPDAKYFNIK